MTDGKANEFTSERQTAKDRLRLWLQMLKAVRHAEAKLREHLREKYNTTLPRFDVLATLHAQPEGMNMSELSRVLIVSNGNVTGVVERLVTEGLVERQTSSSDRRATDVKITPLGKQLMDEMAEDHMHWIDEIFSGVSRADALRTIAVMIDIRDKRQ